MEDDVSAKCPFTKDCRLLWCVLAALLMGFIPAGVWAESYDACGPSPAVKTAFDQLPQQTPADAQWQFLQQHLAALQALLRQYPDDVFIQRAYVQAAHNPPDKTKVIAEYKPRHEENPASAQLAYLYGLALVGRQTPEAIKLFNAALEQDPAFPLPHLELAALYRSPVFLNKPQSTFHLKSFLDACPVSFEGYGVLTGVEDKDFLRPYAAKLRALVESRSDADAVGAYRTLWSLEFKAHPASEYEALRRQVSQDLARLHQLKLEDKPQWYQALEAGYNLVNDKKQADWADEQYLTRFPQPYAAVGMDKWFDEHPPVAAGSLPAMKHAFYSALFAQSGQWLKERPNSFVLENYRMMAIENLDNIPAAEVEADVDEMLAEDVRHFGPEAPRFGAYSLAAEVLSKKHLEPQRVVEWAQKGLAQWEIESKEPPYDLNPPEVQENYTTDRAYRRLQLLGYEIEGYLQLKQAERAQAQLEQMDRWLQDFKPLPGKQNSTRTEAGLDAVYWGLRGRAAALQGRKVDAMAFYEEALLARFTAQQKPEAARKDELADNARQLWASLGGTEEGWQLWYGRPATEFANQANLTWEDANSPLPAFELADLSGKTWNLASLKGKVTFVNFWATWCGPCVMELPRLEKLIEKYKDRSDVLFITLNLDVNPGLAQLFMKEHGFSFVVIPAHTYAWETLNLQGLPANWIVDGNGVVRLKGLGYDPTEKWGTGMQEAIANVQSAAAPASTPVK
jgi:thiol-disulfide isomerase/thioredoxin